MKAIPEFPALDVEPMYESIKGAQVFVLLKAAVDLHLFDRFSKPETAEDFAKRAALDPVLSRKFLNALVATGFLVQQDSRYVNTELASIYLTQDSPFYQGHLLGLMEQTLRDRWANLVARLKDGAARREKKEERIFNKGFIIAMAEGAMRGGLHQTRRIVAALPEFSSAKTLLDLGGGHGLYAIAFAQANANLKCVVFDLPPVLDVAKEYIDQYAMGDRVSVIGGDYLHDPIGGGYDVVFASDSLYKPKDVLLPVLDKIRTSLRDKGVFVCKHWLLEETGTAPQTTVLWDLMVSITGDFAGYTYSAKEFQEVLESVGFTVEIIDISTPSKPSVIFACRKGGK